jgi:HlyD family type I secretion membrane fusion protein
MMRDLVHHVRDVARRGETLLTDGSRHADFLPGTLAVSERPPRAFALLMIGFIGAFVAVALLWMALGKVDEVAAATGKVRPLQQVHVVNHPAGGKITALHVRAGDHVRAGQVLVSFDPETVRQEIAKKRIERDTLVAEVARLEAAAAGKEAPVFPPGVAPEIVSTQLQLFAANRAQFAEQTRQAESVITQKRSAVAQAEIRFSTAEQGLRITREQAAALQALADKGYYPRLRALSAARELAAQQGEADQSRAALAAAQAELEGAVARGAEIAGANTASILKELAEKRSARDRSVHEFVQVQAAQNNLELAAPVDGFVETIKVANAGQSVLAGQEILHVVPDAADYVLDTRVANKDIGHVRPGQAATIKLHAFDYQRFGTVAGVVTHVPAEGQADERTGETFYTVTVRPDRNHPGADARAAVRPGMVADVDLHLGRRSVLSYLTDTVLRTRDQAFREY